MIPNVKSQCQTLAGFPDRSSLRSIRGGVLPVVIAIFFLLLQYQVGAATISYRQGLTNVYAPNYQGTSDTMLLSTSPDYNFGTSLSCYFGPSDSTGLLRFDLTTFSGKYARITGMSLAMRIGQINSPPAEGDLSIYQVSEANAGWVAGIANGLSQAGASTWNQLSYNTVNWAGSKGAKMAGVDFNTTTLATHHWSNTGDFVMNFSGTPAQLRALVNQWAGPQNFNAGLLLRNVRTGDTPGTAAFLSANTTLTDKRPTLTITYTTGPALIIEQPSGTELVNGSSSIDFGVSAVGSAGSNKTFTLRNDGTTTLNSIVVSATGGNSADFTVGAPGASTLAPGASTTFIVGFTPGGPAVRSSTLQITSNDTTASPFNIGLTGSGWTSLQAWRNQYFQTINNAGDAADNADPDEDGLGNFLEFAIGSDPKVFDAHGPLSLEVSPEGVVTVSFKRARPATEVTYTVRVSTDLSAWGDYAVNPGTVGLDAVLTDNVSASALRFFRLNVQATP